jgi:hypothetical protein
MIDLEIFPHNIEAEQARIEALIQQFYFMKSEKSLLTHLKHTINNDVPGSLYKMKKVKSDMKN